MNETQTGKPEQTNNTANNAASILEPWLQKWGLPLLLTWTAIIYLKTLQNTITQFDDYYYITDNPLIRSLSWEGLKAIFTTFHAANYHPLTTLSHAIDYSLFGLNPIPYHLGNVVLHLLNTYLAFLFAKQLSGKALTGFVVAALFALHPMHVESVAWASERKDVLYAAFYLAALIANMRHQDGKSDPKTYAATLLLFVLALLSKSAAVTLPVLMIAIDLYKGRKITTRSILEKLPFLLLSVVFGLITIASQNADNALGDLTPMYGWWNRLFLVTAAISSYLLRLLAPVNLSAMHFFPELVTGKLPYIYYLSLPFILALAYAIYQLKAHRKELLFGCSFFLITISVMLQIITVGSCLTAERYTYISYIGLFYGAGQLISGIKSMTIKNGVLAGLVVVLLVFSVQDWYRIGIWKNDTTLYGDIRAKYPETSKKVAMGFGIQGNEAKEKGDTKKAIVSYTQAILFDPQSHIALSCRGFALLETGDTSLALQDFNRAIEIAPNLAEPYYFRALARYKMNQFGAAISDFDAAIRVNPAFTDAYTNRGNTHYIQGDTTAALADFDKAITLNPKNEQAYTSRAWLHHQAGHTKQAIADYTQLTILNPKNTTAYGSLAALRSNQGDYPQALKDYNALLAIAPSDHVALLERGHVHLKLKDSTAAYADWEVAAKLGNEQAIQLINNRANK